MVSQTLDRGYNVCASTEINSSVESHRIQFHSPTSAMFDGKRPLERRKVGSIAVANASQKTQLLAESARQCVLQLFFPRIRSSIFWGSRLTYHLRSTGAHQSSVGEAQF
jgi:hypothetical protein